MASTDIQQKVQDLLTSTRSFTKEMEAVYLLVELRKLIEQSSRDLPVSYRNIKFYCDWALHTEKTRSFQGLEDVFEEIYQDCKNHIELAPQVIEAKKLVEFLYFSHLREHMRVLFQEFGFDMSLLDDDEKWASFVIQLLNVLMDQPIKNIPNEHLEMIYIVSANNRSAGIRVVFVEPVYDRTGQEHPSYDALNAFY